MAWHSSSLASVGQSLSSPPLLALLSTNHLSPYTLPRLQNNARLPLILCGWTVANAVHLLDGEARTGSRQPACRRRCRNRRDRYNDFGPDRLVDVTGSRLSDGREHRSTLS